MDKLISKIRSKLTHGSFARNVLVMLVGTTLGQLTSLLLSPILTRIYSPDFFGILGFFTATISILSVLASLRYEMAMTLTKNIKETANLLSVCITTIFTTTAIFYIILLFFPENYIKPVFGALEPYRYLLPVGFFCIGAYDIMLGLATLKGSFAIISKTKIYQGVTGPTMQIILGIIGLGPLGLIIGFIIGQSAGFINMFQNLVIKPKDLLHNITLQGMKEVAVRFHRFPLISTFSSLISALGGNNLLLVAVPLLYSSTIAGFIFLTDRIIGRPLMLISTSILQVYIGESAKTQTSDPKAMRKRFLQVTRIQFFIVSFWLALINLTAFYFVPIVFGKEWADAAIYINILSISYLPQMVMVSVTHTLQILEKQGLMAMWEFSRFIFITSGFIMSYILKLEAPHAILVYSSSQATMQIILFGLMYYSIQKIQPKTDTQP